jgi:hypothetical protein
VSLPKPRTALLVDECALTEHREASEEEVSRML